MDIYEDTFINLWKCLNRNNVRYVMVGGFANYLHGHYRTTLDIDLYLDDTLENRKKLRQAFKDLGLGDFEPMNVPFLHINQLIDNKKAVNRPKDQSDVVELEKIRDLSGEK